MSWKKLDWNNKNQLERKYSIYLHKRAEWVQDVRKNKISKLQLRHTVYEKQVVSIDQVISTTKQGWQPSLGRIYCIKIERYYSNHQTHKLVDLNRP
jgi:hypothetical protein